MLLHRTNDLSCSSNIELQEPLSVLVCERLSQDFASLPVCAGGPDRRMINL